jgi:Domain of unknown function DUF11
MAGETIPPKKEDEGRRQAREAERLESLRERLYARGGPSEPERVRHELSNTAPTPADSRRVPPPAPLTASTPAPMPQRSPRRSYRIKIALLGILFFIGALGVSSMFLFMGNNTISGNNIAIDVSGPLSVGGGESMNLQIAIANQNTLPIESATLIITYPRGAQSVTESGKELFTERQQLNNIDPNEVVNVPLRLLMFGEENDTKKISVSVEYRVRGSNATFYKEALPFEFKISSSPVVINVNSVKSISSGQEATIELVVQSNSLEELTNLLVKASYPQGFEFTESNPETASGQDTWRIASLAPGEEKKILVKGILTGNEDDTNTFTFESGVANERDDFNIVSKLTEREAVIRIERPFLDVKVSVNGDSDEVIVVEPSAPVRVVIEFENVLETTVYDGVIQVALSGNALNEILVRPEEGNYDSSTNILTWDSIDVNELRELTPGTSHNVAFSVEPREDIKENPEIKVSVTVQGNRVSEDRVPEQVVGTIERTIKIASLTKLASSALYTEGPFTNSGPTPPVAEKTTEYAFLLTVRNGTNPVTSAEVTAVMPAYVTWLDRSSDDAAISYNQANRSIKWNIGDLKANEYREVWIQVAFKPSLSQFNLTPTLLETQRFRATDRFTGTVVRTDAPALTTALVNDPDSSVRDGRVKKD